MIMTMWADMRGDERALFVMMAVASCLSLVIFACVLSACGAFHWLAPAGSGEVVSVEVSGEEVGENKKKIFENENEEDFEEGEEEAEGVLWPEDYEFIDEVKAEVADGTGFWGVCYEDEYSGLWDYFVGPDVSCWRWLWELSRREGDSARVFVVSPFGSVSGHTVSDAMKVFDDMRR